MTTFHIVFSTTIHLCDFRIFLAAFLLTLNVRDVPDFQDDLLILLAIATDQIYSVTRLTLTQ